MIHCHMTVNRKCQLVHTLLALLCTNNVTHHSVIGMRMAVHAAKPATHAGHLGQQWHGHHTWVTPLLGQHGYKAGQGPGQGFIVQKMASPTATQPMVFTLPSNGSQMLYLDNTATDYRVQLPSQIVLNRVGSFMFLSHHKHVDEEDIHQALQDAVPRQLQQHPKCLGWAEWWAGSHSLSGSMPHDRGLQASPEIVHGLGGHHTVLVPAARLARRGDGAHRAWQHVHRGPILTKARVSTQCVHSLLPGPWMPTWWAMSITAYRAPCLQRADLARLCTTNCTGWTGCQCAGPSSSMSTWLWWTATAKGCHSRAGPAQLSCRWGWEVGLRQGEQHDALHRRPVPVEPQPEQHLLGSVFTAIPLLMGPVLYTGDMLRGKNMWPLVAPSCRQLAQMSHQPRDAWLPPSDTSTRPAHHTGVVTNGHRDIFAW